MDGVNHSCGRAERVNLVTRASPPRQWRWSKTSVTQPLEHRNSSPLSASQGQLVLAESNDLMYQFFDGSWSEGFKYKGNPGIPTADDKGLEADRLVIGKAEDYINSAGEGTKPLLYKFDTGFQTNNTTITPSVGKSDLPGVSATRSMISWSNLSAGKTGAIDYSEGRLIAYRGKLIKSIAIDGTLVIKGASSKTWYHLHKFDGSKSGHWFVRDWCRAGSDHVSFLYYSDYIGDENKLKLELGGSGSGITVGIQYRITIFD